jgi:hypothetical protein
MPNDFIKSPLELLYEHAGIPHLAGGGQPLQGQIAGGHTPMTTIQKAAMAGGLGTGGYTPPANAPFNMEGYTPPEFIKAYRADPKHKYGGKEGLETLPTHYDKQNIVEYVRAMRAGEKHGVPQLPPEYLTNLLLTEGRSDFGFNEMNWKNPKAAKISTALATSGQHEDDASDFAGAIYDKMKTAMRIGKPFSTVWNGTGISKAGKTGNDYSKRFTDTFAATMHPQNADLLNTVRDAYNNYQPPTTATAPDQTASMPNVDIMSNVTGYAMGGSVQPKTFFDMSRELIKKHISGK